MEHNTADQDIVRYYTVFGFKGIPENRYTKKMVPLEKKIYEEILKHSKIQNAIGRHELTVLTSWKEFEDDFFQSDTFKIVVDDHFHDVLNADIMNKICLQ